MSLKKVIIDDDLSPLLLGETPGFRTYKKEIKNPLAGTSKPHLIHAPNDAMRLIHGRVISSIRALGIRMPHATACRPGDSTRKNVQKHAGNRFFVLLDLTHAYRNVQIEKLAKVLCDVDKELIGHRRAVEDFLGQYIVSPVVGGVAEGGPASPDLFNLFCAILLDPELANLCKKRGLTYTRYLDDITVSGNTPIGEALRRRIRRIIAEAGFQVKHKKAKVWDVERRGSVIITGIALGANGRIFVPRSYISWVEELLREGIQGKPWLLPKISGAMSTFRSIVDCKHPNTQEARVLGLERTFRHLVAQQKLLLV